MRLRPATSSVRLVLCQFLFVQIAITVLWQPVLGSRSRPPGCVAPETIGKALEVISKSDWNEISETDLASIWPKELKPSECSGSCRTMLRDDESTNGECVCCESFDFQINHETEGLPARAYLDSIVIHYASDNSKDILAVAKTFAMAIGMPSNDAAKIRRGRRQEFDWDVDSGKVVAVMTIQVWRERGIWKLYVIVGRFPI